MSQSALRAVELGKRYRIGARQERATTLREAMVRTIRAPVDNLRRLRRLTAFTGGAEPDVVWALRDASFEVGHGEVLGVIGRNGAGKSTLLKILSRITNPTTGHALVFGRVGSLLEVGTGFHPELTGRDNVYLNGSILGMDRRHIERKFDAIVEFSGVERFIDTPVKRYSSGMYLRLAFAVAAHLEPDVLVVDEVLAVGDLDFQRKCIGRMDEVAREGRTVLFVSHNLGAVQRLCTRSILLDAGRLVADGETAQVVSRYLAGGASDTPAARWLDLSEAQRVGTGAARVGAVRYASDDMLIGERPYPGGPLEIAVKIHAPAFVGRATVGFRVEDRFGVPLLAGSTTAIGRRAVVPEGASTWVFRIARLPLRPGGYSLALWITDLTGQVLDRVTSAISLEVFDRHQPGQPACYDPRYDGTVYCEYDVRASVENGAVEVPRDLEEAV